MIHKILQFIENIPENLREEKIREFLRKNDSKMSDFAVNNIKDEILHLLNNAEFSFMFEKSAKKEVAVMGEVDGKIVSAQIDRLIIKEDKVIIVDYKTNRPAAEKMDNVPKIYKKQLETYSKLLEKIYPGKVVEAYILWTNSAMLMKII